MTITFPELKETEGKLAAKQAELAALFSEATNDQGVLDATKVKGYANGDELAAATKALNDEMTDLAKERDRLLTLKRGAELANDDLDFGEPEGNSPARPAKVKDFGQIFVESKAGSDLKGQEVFVSDVELKTLFSTTAGWAADVIRTPRMVPDEQRPVQVADYIPTRSTDQTAVTYMEETTFTNTAAEVAEGGTKPEATLALTERTSTVRKIAVWIPVTDEQLEDVAGIQEYLNNRLGFMVRQRLDQQIVSGDGTAPNLRGLLNVSGIQTQAKGADPVPDAIYKAMTKVRVTGQSVPNLVILHPNDWQDIRLLRTADGIYIWGSPSEAGPERIWGLDVAQVQAATENTGVVLDTSFTELAMKKGLTLKVSDSHSTYFVENKQVVLAELRAAFTVFRPSSVCTVTGI